MPDSKAARILREGIDQLRLDLDDAVQGRLMQYLNLLLRWNRAYNLIAHAPADILVARHLLDSLAVLPWLKGQTAADLGSGAGLPGLPLALAEPKRQWHLVDSSGKRVRFLRHVARELGITQVRAVVSRVEQWQPGTIPDMVIFRAVSSPLKALTMCRHMLANEGLMYLMLGKVPAQELQQLPAGYSLRALETLQVPYLDAERHLAVVQAVNDPTAN